MLTTPMPAIGLRAKLFRGFADPSRLAIVEVLRDGPRTVGEIVHITGLSQSNTSNHLGCLRECGLVLATQRGRFISYTLSDERVAELLQLADALLSDVAHGIDACTRYCASPPSEPESRLESHDDARC